MRTDGILGCTPLINWDNFWLWYVTPATHVFVSWARTDPWSNGENLIARPVHRWIWDQDVDRCGYKPL